MSKNKKSVRSTLLIIKVKYDPENFDAEGIPTFFDEMLEVGGEKHCPLEIGITEIGIFRSVELGDTDSCASMLAKLALMQALDILEKQSSADDRRHLAAALLGSAIQKAMQDEK